MQDAFDVDGSSARPERSSLYDVKIVGLWCVAAASRSSIFYKSSISWFEKSQKSIESVTDSDNPCMYDWKSVCKDSE